MARRYVLEAYETDSATSGAGRLVSREVLDGEDGVTTLVRALRRMTDGRTREGILVSRLYHEVVTKRDDRRRHE